MKYFVTVDADGRRTGSYRKGQPNIPKGAVEVDRATYLEWIENDLTRRWDWETSQLVECELPVHTPSWEEIRMQRNNLLRQSDWTQLPDAPADNKLWKVYRQALRDIPQTYSDPATVVWPAHPDSH
jgi:hypothetical protein